MNQSGFTLVETLVAVAIVGVLGSIANANYQKYMARGRQSEAKISLSTAYTREMAYYAEMATFTACLRQAGYYPTNSDSKRYYSISAPTGMGPTCGPLSDQSCLCYTFQSTGGCSLTCTTGTDDYYAANLKMRENPTPLLSQAVPAIMGTSVFTISAMGSISTTGANYLDVWTIDQSKLLTNYAAGM